MLFLAVLGDTVEEELLNRGAGLSVKFHTSANSGYRDGSVVGNFEASHISFGASPRLERIIG